MKVYIVTAGDISGHGNVGVFSTRQAAEEYVARTEPGRHDSTEIEEHAIDDPEHLGTEVDRSWSCTMFLGDGAIYAGDVAYIGRPSDRHGLGWHPAGECAERTCLLTPSELARLGRADSVEVRETGWSVKPQEQVVVVKTWVSADHAMRLAAEARQKWLRERAGA